jgi:hypothetical protein
LDELEPAEGAPAAPRSIALRARQASLAPHSAPHSAPRPAPLALAGALSFPLRSPLAPRPARAPLPQPGTGADTPTLAPPAVAVASPFARPRPRDPPPAGGARGTCAADDAGRGQSPHRISDLGLSDLRVLACGRAGGSRWWCVAQAHTLKLGASASAVGVWGLYTWVSSVGKGGFRKLVVGVVLVGGCGG